MGQEVEIDLDKLGSNASYHRHGISLNPKLEKLEYPRNDIIYIRDLGQGAFGRVFQVCLPSFAHIFYSNELFILKATDGQFMCGWFLI